MSDNNDSVKRSNTVTPAKNSNVQSPAVCSEKQVHSSGSDFNTMLSDISQSFGDYRNLHARELQKRNEHQDDFAVRGFLRFQYGNTQIHELASFSERLREFASSLTSSCEDQARRSGSLLEQVREERENMHFDFFKLTDKLKRDQEVFGKEVVEVEKTMVRRLEKFQEQVRELEEENGRLKRKIMEQEQYQRVANKRHLQETQRLNRELDAVAASRRRESEMAHEEIRRLKMLGGEEIDEDETQLF